MTSVLLEDERTAGRTKSNSGNQKILINGITSTAGEESRSFLNFSRENLSISHSDLEQSFNKSSRCFGVNRQTLLSVIAIVVALACAGIEIWKLHRVVTNAREIEILKRDVESLRHRIFGKDFMDEIKAFEEQLYADETEGDEDSGEGADYDNYYEDYGPSWSDDVEDSRELAAETSGSIQESQNSPKGAELKSTSSSASHDSKLVEMLAVHHKVETKRGQEFEKSAHDMHKNIARERLLDGSREHGANKRHMELQQENTKDDHPKQRRAVITDEVPVKYTGNGVPICTEPYSHDERDSNHTRHEIIDDSGEALAKETKKSRDPPTEATPWDRYPLKKYFAHARSDNSDAFPPSRHSSRRRSSSFSERKELQRLQQDSEVPKKSLQLGGITRRHLRAPRQVFAAHYGADSTLFGMNDEHTGNGRAKHNEGIFKAWRPSDWVTELGMTRHFTFSRDGKLTVHEPGLYLVYGQIHYLDEHDENGFHILVNGHPILQCMVYSPGVGHKSRSCFSAQITILQAGDNMVLKDVGSARYTLFQHDKSFFGLVKLGDSRQQQQQLKQHSTQPTETRR